MKPKTWLLIIDGDPVPYRAGFAGQSENYEVVLENRDTGFMMQHYFRRGEDRTARQNMNAWLEANPAFAVVAEERHIEAEPLENVLQMVRAQMDSIIKEVQDYYKIDKRDLYVHVVLSGGINFRDDIGKLKGYKANRDKSHKPVHFNAIRDYLIRKYGAYVTDGIEADDHCSLRAHAAARSGYDSYVVATIDKDLDQIPGHHYNYMQKVHYDVTEADGRLWFWRQVLSGDSTDNIGGACFVGPKSADAYADELWPLSERERWERVCEIYAERAKRRGCYYAETDPVEAALENARLVYLQRRDGELWTPPGEQPEFLEKVSIDD